MIKKFLFLLFAFLLLFLVFKGIIKSFILIYIIFVNVAGMAYMYYDKKISTFGKPALRVSEKKLMTIAFLGGAPFMLLSMFIFRHKVLKIKFLIGIPLLFFWNLILYYLILRI